MARKYPIVLVDGTPRQLPPDDTLVSYNIGSVSASSGLVGGGDLSTGSKRLDVALAPNASGIIFVGDTIGLDGQDLVVADTAQASGNAALSASSVALASGVAAQSAANTALASGSAALSDIQNYTSRTSLTLVAGSYIPKGGPVGLDDSGKAQLIRYVRSNQGVNVIDKSSFSKAASTLYPYARYFPSLGLFGFSYRTPGTGYPGFVLGQPSGTTIQYGTNVVVASLVTGTTSCEYDPVLSGVVYAYTVSNQYRCAFGTISGLSCTFPADVQVQANTMNVAYRNYAVYDTTAQKTSLWYTWYDGASTFYGSSRPISSASGATITLGTRSDWGSNTTNYYYHFSVVDNPIQQRANVTYYNSSNNYMGSRTAFWNGSSYTYGTAAQLTNTPNYLSTCYSPKDDKIHYIFAASNLTYAGLISISGSTSTIDAASVISNTYGTYYSTVYDSGNSRILSFFDNANFGSRLSTFEAVISGSSLNYSPNIYQFGEYASFMVAPPFVPSGQTLVAYNDILQNSSGNATLIQSTNLVQPTLATRQNYLGTAQTAATSGGAVRVLLPVATDLNQTGLNPGHFYYVDPNTSGYTTNSGVPSYTLGSGSFPTWSGVDNWGYVAKAVTTSGLLMLRSIQ